MNKKIFKIILVALVVLAPTLVMAATLQQPPIPIDGGSKPVTLAEIEDLIKQIVQFGMVISLLIATGAIVWGAINWMIGGDGDPRKGKDWIWSGIKGAAVILAIGVILNTVASLITRGFFR